MTELKRRPHARTNFSPEEFIDAYENASSEAEKQDIREALRRIDDGRFYEFLDAAHNVLARSDLKRRREFQENYSDHLIRWIKVFGMIEDLNTFQDIRV